MKHKKRIIQILVMALMLTFLAGCTKEKVPEVLPQTEASIQEILKKSFDAMDTQTSVQLSCINDYTLTMTLMQEGVSINNKIANSYTNTYKYVKGTGFIGNAESDYSVFSTLPGVSEETLNQSLKLSYYSYYDEATDVYYHTDVNDITKWIKVNNMDIDGMIPALKEAILLCSTSLTMQQTDTEIRISQPLSALYPSEGFQAFLTKYGNVLDNISEFSALLPVASVGTVTYVIDAKTFLFKEVLISDIQISNSSLATVLDNDNAEALNGSSLNGNIHVFFSDYNKVDVTEISKRGETAIAEALSTQEIVPNITTDPTQDLANLEPEIIYESDTAFDRYDVTSYAFKDLSLADMNIININGADHAFPFNISVLGENGWVVNDVDGDAWIRYFHSDYDEFSELDAYDVFQTGSYDSLATDGVFGINWNVYNAVLNNTPYPEALFTSYGISFGMSAPEVLTLLGKPDTVYIGNDMDVYQYSLYDMTKSDNLKTYSLILHFYHTPDIEGLYTIDIQYLAEGDVPNGN